MQQSIELAQDHNRGNILGGKISEQKATEIQWCHDETGTNGNPHEVAFRSHKTNIECSTKIN